MLHSMATFVLFSMGQLTSMLEPAHNLYYSCFQCLLWERLSALLNNIMFMEVDWICCALVSLVNGGKRAVSSYYGKIMF